MHVLSEFSFLFFGAAVASAYAYSQSGALGIRKVIDNREGKALQCLYIIALGVLSIAAMHMQSWQ
jgi:hypothetical protein